MGLDKHRWNTPGRESFSGEPLSMWEIVARKPLAVQFGIQFVPVSVDDPSEPARTWLCISEAEGLAFVARKPENSRPASAEDLSFSNGTEVCLREG